MSMCHNDNNNNNDNNNDDNNDDNDHNDNDDINNIIINSDNDNNNNNNNKRAWSSASLSRASWPREEEPGLSSDRSRKPSGPKLLSTWYSILYSI